MRTVVSFHHHLPGLISRAISLAPRDTGILRGAARLIEVGLVQLPGLPRAWKRAIERKQGRPHRYSLREQQAGPPLLVHYHIFKNAGISFETTLGENLGQGFGRYDQELVTVLAAEYLAHHLSCNQHLSALSSHQATLPPPLIPGRKVITSILIRDPIARIRSIYSFEHRRQDSLPGRIKAKDVDFKTYIEWRLFTTPSILCNYQVHFCSRTKATRRNFLVDESHLHKAIANLDQIDIVGTVQRYSDWLRLAQAVLAQDFPDIALTVARKNVSDSNRENPDEATIYDELVRDLGQTLADRLLQANQLDMALHQVADALLTRRLAEQDVHVVLRNAYADARQRLSATTPQA